ncbi:uncharacterized protein LOC107036233 [Diachasma alloeum]|uniref:uncharacterized protein LOC107036233 n=1 Tax=Diachasma alloeum TaxID=454923 RepID=UPI0007383D15|nr:uncharacterized protein LOC107036233 [Diachasma alloeum]
MRGFTSLFWSFVTLYVANAVQLHKVLETVKGFEDLEKAAVLTIRQRTDSSREIIGTIASENLVITSIPERLIEEVKRQRRSVDDVPESEQDDHHYHIVYRRAPPPVDDKYPYYWQPTIPQNQRKLRALRSGWSLPKI